MAKRFRKLLNVKGSTISVRARDGQPFKKSESLKVTRRDGAPLVLAKGGRPTIRRVRTTDGSAVKVLARNASTSAVRTMDGGIVTIVGKGALPKAVRKKAAKKRVVKRSKSK